MIDEPRFIIYDPSRRKYWALGKWTRYAEDAFAYSTDRVAHARRRDLSRQLERDLEVIEAVRSKRRNVE